LTGEKIVAYMNTEIKNRIARNVKPVLKKYGMSGTLAVHNHSMIILNLRSGPIDFGSNYVEPNPYWFHKHYEGVAKDFLTEAFDALKSADWFDKSDVMTDYFHTAYYYRINVGRWNRDYVLTA
jgi:hypothetical protein